MNKTDENKRFSFSFQVKAVLRTFNPRQVRYYQADGKIRVAVFKQHINRARNMLMNVVNLVKFIDYCFQWENPLLSFSAFMVKTNEYVEFFQS